VKRGRRGKRNRRNGKNDMRKQEKGGEEKHTQCPPVTKTILRKSIIRLFTNKYYPFVQL
jgi:hypothetical protein